MNVATTFDPAKLGAVVDALQPAAVKFLAELVKVPSDNPPGDCAPHAARATELLQQLGFEVEAYPLPPDLVKANGMISASNLIVRRKYGKGGPTVALNAHGDVVAPGGGWTHDPYGAEIADGVMYGRGVAVSKSDFATYAFALLALEKAKVPLAGTVELHFTYDEEAGGEIGPKWILQEGLSKPDFAISAGFSYAVVTHHNGVLHLEVTVHGRSAHAARPDTGVDALEAANALLTVFYAYRKSITTRKSRVPGIDAPSAVVGLISGGINTNVVPDKVSFRIDRRIVPEENPEEVEAELVALFTNMSKSWADIRVETKRIMLAVPFKPVGPAGKLAGFFQAAAEAEFATPILRTGVPLYTDARHYAAAGIPTILYGAGPRSLLEANGHRADEKLVLEDLRKATRTVARALADLLKPGG